MPMPMPLPRYLLTVDDLPPTSYPTRELAVDAYVAAVAAHPTRAVRLTHAGVALLSAGPWPLAGVPDAR
jgi:hypothetical protein